MKNIIKATKAINANKNDIRESKFVCGRAMKRDAKKSANRAIRRLGIAIIKEAA